MLGQASSPLLQIKFKSTSSLVISVSIRIHINSYVTFNLYYNTVLDMSVILFVRYRNHFPVIQFQSQAHIWNPHGTGQVFKTIWSAAGTPIFFPLFIIAAPSGAHPGVPIMGHPSHPKFLINIFFYRRPRRRFFPNKRPGRRSTGGRGKSRQRRMFHEYLIKYLKIKVIFLIKDNLPILLAS